MEHLGAKAVQAIAGKTSEQIAERASGSSLGNRHQTSLKNQAKAAKKAEENGEKVGKVAAKGVEVADRANDNNKNKNKER